MKTTIITIIILFFNLSSTHGQLIEPAPDSSPQEFYDYYMIKNQKNKRAAWICLGGGAGLFVIGTAVGTAGLLDWDSSQMGAGTGMMLAGIVGAAVSVPLFISAGSNKRKARLHFSSTQNTVANIKLDNSKSFGVLLKIPLN
jgi:hypothetical protein